MKTALLIVLVLPVIMFLSGCATVIHGTTQSVPVTSRPTGANVNVDGAANYVTPVTIELKRKMDHVLTISKAGFKTQVVTLIHTISAAVAGNIIAGGLIGWGVDAATGAQYKLIPATVNVVLEPGVGQSTEVIMVPQTVEPSETVTEVEKIEVESQKIEKAPAKYDEAEKRASERQKMMKHRRRR